MAIFPPLKKSFHGPNAVILCDIQHKIHPELHASYRVEWLDFYLPHIFERADAVLLVSQSENPLLERFFGKKAADKGDIKTLQTLLTAFERVSAQHRDLFLFLVGQDSPSNRKFINTKLSSAAKRRVRLLGYLPDTRLGLLYRKSEPVVIPSLRIRNASR
jgi:hypothetical protein